MKSNDTIIYVDDEAINLKLFSIMFHGIYEVLTFESPQMALEELKVCPEVKAVITDMKMPVMNGLQFVELAREINNTIPYFLLSGYGLTREINEALKNESLNGYFQKPFRKELIILELSKYI
ncbi:response regulator [Labilibacter sediminis]|nr:response regulator [Labilibacter sediminis]